MKTNTALPVFAQKFYRNYKASVQKPKIWYLANIDLVYLQIPKIASTSVTRSLSKFMLDQRGPVIGLEEVGRKQVRAIAEVCASHSSPKDTARKYKTAYKFSLVRNPLERLWSCYKNKVLDPYRSGGENIFWNHGIQLDMSFDAFVHRMAKIPDHKINRHLKSQYWYLYCQDRCLANYIARFENLAQDWSELVAQFGLPELPHANPSSEYKQSYKEGYSKQTARIASDRYQRDIELFGYREEISDML